VTPKAQPGPMDRKQRRGAIVSGLVLAAMALGIYLTVIVKFFVY
jgi:hypothetical protein